MLETFENLPRNENKMKFLQRKVMPLFIKYALCAKQFLKYLYLRVLEFYNYCLSLFRNIVQQFPR